MKSLSRKCIKILKTFNIYLCFFSLGLCGAVPGPCLLDLEKMVNTDTQHIGVIYTTRSIGYLVGGLLGGILLDAIKSKQIVMTVFNFLSTLATFGIPWSRNLGTLTGIFFAHGFSMGAIDVGGNVICLTLWGSDSGPFYQALHLNFGLGALVAPLIAAPFLADYSHLHSEDNSSLRDYSHLPTEDNSTYSNYTNDFTNASVEYFNHNSSEPVYIQTNMIYPFSIIGIFCLITTIMFLTTSVISPVEEKRSRSIQTKDKKVKFGYLFSVVFLGTLFLFSALGIEMGYPQMLTTYVVTGRLQLSSSVGSYMTSAFFATYTLSRLASVFLAIKISSFGLIVYDLVVLLIGSLVLLILASYEWAVWLASVLLGAGVATFYPSTVAWIDSYISITNKIAAVFNVGVSASQMAIPLTISYFAETVPDALTYIVFALCALSYLIFIMLYLILRKRQKKDTGKELDYFVVDNSAANT